MISSYSVTNIPELLTIATEAALQAGKAIMEVYTSGNFEIEEKADNSPLTVADTAANSIINQYLEKTGLPILSEEGKKIPYDDRKKWNLFWMIDPLDGTKEFISKNGDFTVNIALIHFNNPVAGVIYAPYKNILYYGSEETGVYKTEDGKQTQLFSNAVKTSFENFRQKQEVTIVASKSHLNDATKELINSFKNVKLISVGSSIKFMLLAEGIADIYPRLAPTMEWDIAAAHALLIALNKGIYKTDLKSELLYNKKELLNPYFISF